MTDWRVEARKRCDQETYPRVRGPAWFVDDSKTLSDARYGEFARLYLPRALDELDKADARVAELEKQLAQSDAVISTLDVRRLVFAHPIDSPVSPHWASVSEAIERHRVRVTVKAEGKP